MLEIMHTYDEHGDSVQGNRQIPEAARERLRLAADLRVLLNGRVIMPLSEGVEWIFLFGTVLKPQPLGGAQKGRPRDGSGRDPQRLGMAFVRGLR